jgi:hypothetical protein
MSFLGDILVILVRYAAALRTLRNLRSRYKLKQCYNDFILIQISTVNSNPNNTAPIITSLPTIFINVKFSKL